MIPARKITRPFRMLAAVFTFTAIVLALTGDAVPAWYAAVFTTLLAIEHWLMAGYVEATDAVIESGDALIETLMRGRR